MLKGEAEVKNAEARKREFEEGEGKRKAEEELEGEGERTLWDQGEAGHKRKTEEEEVDEETKKMRRQTERWLRQNPDLSGNAEVGRGSGSGDPVPEVKPDIEMEELAVEINLIEKWVCRVEEEVRWENRLDRHGCFWDIVRGGGKLPENLVRPARSESVQYMNKRKIWTLKNKKECI